jgi:hypothetical protein
MSSSLYVPNKRRAGARRDGHEHAMTTPMEVINAPSVGAAVTGDSLHNRDRHSSRTIRSFALAGAKLAS